MKNPTLPRSRRAFTLVELLVVIAIIIILAAVGFGVGRGAIQSARERVAQASITNLVLAVDLYYDDYNRLPIPQGGGGGGDQDFQTQTDSTFMNILVGFDEEMNPKGQRFFNDRDAKGSSRNTARGGLFYDPNGASVELFDPFRPERGNRKNQYFFIILDSNYDDEIQSPIGSRTLRGKRAIAWSIGKDGELGSASNKEQTRDNVYSWNE